MSEVRIFRASELDLDDYVALQRAAFAEVLAANRVEADYLSTDFFRWKYAPPAGHGYVAAVLEGGKMLSAIAIFPLEVASKDGQAIAWQACDTATRPEARGKGNFKKCLVDLKNKISRDQIFFGFPNQNSIRGYRGIGWSELGLMSTWVRLNIFSSSWENENIEELRQIPSDYDNFARALQSQCSALVKDSRYLEWRYFNHPQKPYRLLGCRRNGVFLGLISVRRADVMGRRALLIMDLICEHHDVKAELIRSAAAWGYEQGCRLVVDLNNHFSQSDALALGFFRVPQFLLPKRQVFMGAASGGAAAVLLKDRWRLALGDWDGF